MVHGDPWRAVNRPCLSRPGLLQPFGNRLPAALATLLQESDSAGDSRLGPCQADVVEQNRHEHEIVVVRETVVGHPFRAEILAVARGLLQRVAIDDKRVVAV